MESKAHESFQGNCVLQIVNRIFAFILVLGCSIFETHPAPLPKIRVVKDQFETADHQPFTPFGVSYFRPGTGWAPQLWKKFDAEATRQDFRRMKSLGVNCVRVFISFGSFYSEPGRLDPDGLKKFDEFLEIAEEAGIYVHPTGPDHWEGAPEWAKDRVADDQAVAALEEFWKQFAARYRNRTVIFAYDLRNEPEVPWDSPALRQQWSKWVGSKYPDANALAASWHLSKTNLSLANPPLPDPAKAGKHLLDYQLFRESIAENWTARQTAAIKSVDPDALVTVGLIQWSVPALLPGIIHYSGFRPERIAPHVDFMEIHFYPFANGFYEYQPQDEVLNLSYLESITREAALPGKPVVIAEFGWYGGGKLTLDQGKHSFGSEADQARWCEKLIEITRPFSCGWLNWGLFDIPEAGDPSQFIGLLTADGKPKKWGETFQKISTLETSKPHYQQIPRVRPPLDWDSCLTSMKAQSKYREDYLRAFRAEHPDLK